MKRIRYEIKGMSCAACVSHVEHAVRSVLGKDSSFSVSLLTNSLTLVFDDQKIDPTLLENQLSRAIKNAGYSLLTNQKEESADKSRAAQKKRLDRLIASSCLTLLLMYLSMGGMSNLPIPAFLSGGSGAFPMALTQLILTLAVVALNFKFFQSGIRALIHAAPNMDSLIALGSGAAIVYGLISMISMALSHSDAHSLVHDLYFESAAMILTLVSLGKMLESGAKDRASDAIRSLARLSPKTASVLRDGEECELAIEEITVGDVVLVRSGEWIPVDGTVLAGSGSVDESALTGESMPVEKEEGSEARAACVLTSGFLKIRAEGVGENTSLSRIVRLLEDAAASKAPIARVADRVSAVFVPIVIGISILTFLVWMIATGEVSAALRSAIAVMVISCPCALGLATPTAITVGIGRGARAGILFRNAEALEKLCSVNTVLIDKTGTITEGRPSLTDVYAYGCDPRELLSIAASVENASSHPLAHAIVAGAGEGGISLLECEDFEDLTGVGARARVGGVLYRVGKPDADMRAGWDGKKIEQIEKGANIGSIEWLARESEDAAGADFARLESEGKTAVAVMRENQIIGVLGIRDRVRAEASRAIGMLRDEGVCCMMLTGDNERTARAVSNEVGVDRFMAGLLPEDKERVVAHERERGRTVAMVGDGINDAPALVRADVGIAVGAGTEIAIECADVVISDSSPTGVVNAYRLSRRCIRIIKQNLFWALFYNAICIPIAAGVLYPWLGWQLSPMLASAAMSFSSVCVVTNALRLRRVRMEEGSENECRKGECEMLFSSKTEKIEIGVEGMMCPRCVAHVKEAIAALKGVKSVEVSLEEKKATVEIKSGAIEREKIEEAIKAAGYEII